METETKKQNWFRKHWMITIFLGLIALGMVSSIFNNLTGNNTNSGLTGNSIQEQKSIPSNISTIQEEVKTCNPNWQCSSWSDCSSSGTQTRTCTDSNSCGTITSKPEESQTCKQETSLITTLLDNVLPPTSSFTCPDFSSLSDRVSCDNNGYCYYNIVTNNGAGKVGEYKLLPWGYKEGDFITNLADTMSPCKHGEAEGENINNFYCKGMYITSKETDSSGNIISSTNYDVTLVIKDSKIIDSICTKE